MYTNVGKTVKVIAVIFFVLGAIGSLLLGISSATMSMTLLSDIGAILLGIAVTVVCLIVAYVASVLLYAFGQLVDNSDKIRAKLIKDPSVFSLD